MVISLAQIPGGRIPMSNGFKAFIVIPTDFDDPPLPKPGTMAEGTSFLLCFLNGN